MNLPIEPNPGDVAFDRWLARASKLFGLAKILVAMAAGAFLAGLYLFIYGDGRYLRRNEFELHEKTQAALEAHLTDDPKLYVTRTEMTIRLRQLERNQAWQAKALVAIARRNGVVLPPPPLLGYDPEERQ